MPKAGRRGYETPDTIETDDRFIAIVCLPDTPEYRRALVGQLYEMTKWYTWDHDRTGQSTETIARDVANYLKEFILKAIEGCQ
jgi:CO dehydrogenase/acetyl-CoA synthase alpha subunit